MKILGTKMRDDAALRDIMSNTARSCDLTDVKGRKPPFVAPVQCLYNAAEAVFQ